MRPIAARYVPFAGASVKLVSFPTKADAPVESLYIQRIVPTRQQSAARMA